MRTKRFFTGILLAGLLAACLPAAGQFTVKLGGLKLSYETPSKELAKDLAREVDKVEERFEVSRRALRTVRGADGKPAYISEEVRSLIARTEKDLDKTIEQVGGADLSALNAWSRAEIQRIQDEIAAPAPLGGAAALSPRAVAIVASLDTRVVAAASQQETISAERSNGLLDQVGAVISRIFFLAERNDLEVELWVGSLPEKARFSFWSKGKIKDTAPTPTIIQTNGKRKRMPRGLYVYEATWTSGAVTEVISSQTAASLQTERLDLVNGSSYFCCQFDEAYCHHVEDEKECRP